MKKSLIFDSEINNIMFLLYTQCHKHVLSFLFCPAKKGTYYITSFLSGLKTMTAQEHLHHSKTTRKGQRSAFTARHIVIVTPLYNIKFGRNKICVLCFKRQINSRCNYLPYGILLPLLCGRLTKMGMAGDRACRYSSLHCSSLDSVSKSLIMLHVSYVHESLATFALGKLFW